MNLIDFGQKRCERFQSQLDACLRDELSTETALDLQHHLESCAACQAELETRARLRQRLKAAVANQPVPAGLEQRIRRQIRTSQNHSGQNYYGWMLAAAAAVVLMLGGWATWHFRNLQSIESSLPEQTLNVLQLGSGDHLHCAFEAGYKDRTLTLAEMNDKLGTQHAGLLPVTQQSAPEDFQVTVAHQCKHKGRQFVHLLLKNERHLLSVILTRKQDGEWLANNTNNAPQLLQASVQGVQVAGFASHEYLAFIVSDLDRERTQLIAAKLAPAIHDFLNTRQAG